MFALRDEPLRVDDLKRSLEDTRAGACVVFEGWVRNHNEGSEVLRLEYEAYPSLALREGERIIQEALERFDIRNAYCEHRVGLLEIGGVAVWVGVAAEHRRAAFEACSYIIDQIKVRVPIWKREFYADGRAEWVACHHCGHAVHDAHQS